MSQVEIKINNRAFPMTCDDGQEERLLELSERVNDRLLAIKNSVGSVGDLHLLVMTSLFMQDEIEELSSKVQDSDSQKSSGLQEEKFVEIINTIASKIESVNQKINPAAQSS